jgi:hypothetical protein
MSRIVFPGRRLPLKQEVDDDVVVFMSKKVFAQNDFVLDRLILMRSGACLLFREATWWKIEHPVFNADDFFEAVAQFLTGVITVLLPKVPHLNQVTLGTLVENIDGNSLMFNPASHRYQLRTSCRGPVPVQREETINIENRNDIGSQVFSKMLECANEVLNTFRSCELEGNWGHGHQFAFIDEDELREIFLSAGWPETSFVYDECNATLSR